MHTCAVRRLAGFVFSEDLMSIAYVRTFFVSDAISGALIRASITPIIFDASSFRFGKIAKAITTE